MNAQILNEFLILYTSPHDIIDKYKMLSNKIYELHKVKKRQKVLIYLSIIKSTYTKISKYSVFETRFYKNMITLIL